MRGLGDEMSGRGLWGGVKVLLGLGGDAEIEWRERVDFWIVAIVSKLQLLAEAYACESFDGLI